MSRSLNRVTLLGRLGADAEVRFTTGGASVATLNLATERRWKDQKSGEWKSETDWHRVTAWRVENVASYLAKGKSVLIEGRLQTRSYEKDGEKRFVTEVVADNVILLGSNDSERSSAPRTAAPVDGDEEVPF
jgi:single-strand DNA-binding protein